MYFRNYWDTANNLGPSDYGLKENNRMQISLKFCALPPLSGLEFLLRGFAQTTTIAIVRKEEQGWIDSSQSARVGVTTHPLKDL